MTDPPVLIDDPCPYDNCTMPVEVTGHKFMVCDPGGHTCVVFYACFSGHRWQDADACQEVFG